MRWRAIRCGRSGSTTTTAPAMASALIFRTMRDRTPSPRGPTTSPRSPALSPATRPGPRGWGAASRRGDPSLARRGDSHHLGRIACMTSLHRAWATLQPRLKILEPLQFSADHWSLVERLHANFNDREAHTRLPIPIARVREAAMKAIYEHAKQFNDVKTAYVDDSWFAEKFANGTPDTMANYVRLYNDDVDEMMGILVPSAQPRG